MLFSDGAMYRSRHDVTPLSTPLTLINDVTLVVPMGWRYAPPVNDGGVL